MARAHRVHCKTRCVLDYKGSQYSVVLENISINGALITLDRSMDVHPAVNESFCLVLCNNPALCPHKYPCRVVRYSDDVTVGIEFLDVVWNTGLA
jgi:hypothetical protein